MRTACLTIARLSLAGWVGAAVLFVATSVTEQVQPTFDATTKDTLALIRFPWYYGMGFALLGVGGACGFCAATSGRTRVASAVLVLFALVCLGVDYAFVYQPLRAILSPPGRDRPADFESLHRWSETLNTIGLACSFAAAVVLCTARESGRSGVTPSEATPHD